MKRFRRGLGDGHLDGVVMDSLDMVKISATSFGEKEVMKTLDRVKKLIHDHKIVSISGLWNELGDHISKAVLHTTKKLLDLGVKVAERDQASRRLRSMMVSSIVNETNATWNVNTIRAQEMLADNALLQSLLCGNAENWVATVERSFAVYTLLEDLKGQKRATSKKSGEKRARRVKISDFWNDEMGKRGVTLQYRQASRYAQLAKLLLAYPRFLYQNVLNTLDPWLESFESAPSDKALSFISWLHDNMTAGQKAFWATIPQDIRIVRGRGLSEFALHQHGFQVFPLILSVSTDVARIIFDAASSRAHRIFNDAGLDEEDNDGQRKQFPVKKLVRGCAELRNVWERLSAWISVTYPNHQVKDAVVLLSLDGGCLPQIAHTDYTEESLRNVNLLEESSERIPLACILALQDDTPFDVWPGAITFNGEGEPFEHCTVVLNRGDVLIFRGDLVHAGAAFGNANARLHTYLDVEGVNREPDQTFYMDKEDHILPRGKRLLK